MNKSKIDKEEEALKNLFGAFGPELSPEDQFMSRLLQKMDGVEEIRRLNRIALARSRRAACWSALLGFLSGVVSTLLMPFFVGWLHRFVDLAPAAFLSYGEQGAVIIGYCLVAFVTLFVTLFTYRSFSIS